MAFKDLTAHEMLAISGPWTDPDAERVLFEKYNMLSAMLPIVESAHRGLLQTQIGSSSQEAKAESLTDRAQNADLLYDRKARAVYHMLSGFAEYVDSVEGTARILDLREALFPNGLSVVGKSYIDQATASKELKDSLDDDMRAQMQELPVPGGATLEKAVDEWIAAGLEIGTITRERAALKSAADDGTTVSAGDVLRARNKWARSARAVFSMMAFEDILDSEHGRITKNVPEHIL